MASAKQPKPEWIFHDVSMMASFLEELTAVIKNNTSTGIFDILEGPSKWDLMLAAYDSEAHPSVTFRLKANNFASGFPVEVKLELVGAQNEDGTRFFSGRCREVASSGLVCGVYHPGLRKGWFRRSDYL